LLTGSCPDERERRVLEYITCRIGDEVHLGEVIQEEYVCRNASQDEMGEILNTPQLIEATH
jgi:hypothetical protein